jgi:hypothetical protein
MTNFFGCNPVENLNRRLSVSKIVFRLKVKGWADLYNTYGRLPIWSRFPFGLQKNIVRGLYTRNPKRKFIETKSFVAPTQII